MAQIELLDSEKKKREILEEKRCIEKTLLSWEEAMNRMIGKSEKKYVLILCSKKFFSK